MSGSTGFFKKLLIVIGVALALLAVFIGTRIYLNDQKEAERQLEAQKIQVSTAEAQKLDLGGVVEGEFMVIGEPDVAVAAPSPEQWQHLLDAMKKTTVPMLFPGQAPLSSLKLGRIRHVVKADSYLVKLDCRNALPEAEKNNCGAVTISANTLSEDKRAVAQEVINALVKEPTVDYAKIRLQGTDGQDQPIRIGNLVLAYNGFCSDIGCNASVSFLLGSLEVKIEGSGDLEPWFTALAREAGQVQQAPR